MIYVQTNSLSLIQKVVAGLLGVIMLALLVMFSVVMIPLIAIMGLIGFTYLYWKTRALRQAMAQAAQDHGVIEGEAIVIHEQQEIKHLK